jgi:hypothetical protein
VNTLLNSINNDLERLCLISFVSNDEYFVVSDTCLLEGLNHISDHVRWPAHVHHLQLVQLHHVFVDGGAAEFLAHGAVRESPSWNALPKLEPELCVGGVGLADQVNLVRDHQLLSVLCRNQEAERVLRESLFAKSDIA